MGYSFFFSYASIDDRASKGRVRWFFDRLYDNLQVAHGNVSDAFFAPRGIEAGEKWREELAKALNSSSVFVCLQSPQYFASDICGQELEVFLQRRKLFRKRGGEPPACIIPVLWHPIDNVPKAVPNDFQGKKPSIDLVEFEKDGLYEAILMDRSPGKENIEFYALKLAQRISNLIRRNEGVFALPALPILPDLDFIPSAFDPPKWPLPDVNEEKGTGPTSITFVYPCGVPPESLPFPPPPNAVIKAAELVKSREWVFQGIGFDDRSGFMEKIHWAQEKRSPVVLMLTEPILGDPNFLNLFTNMPARGIATVVLSTKDDGQLPEHFPAALRADAVITTRTSFEETLVSKLAKLRNTILSEPTSDTAGALPTF